MLVMGFKTGLKTRSVHERVWQHGTVYRVMSCIVCMIGFQMRDLNFTALLSKNQSPPLLLCFSPEEYKPKINHLPAQPEEQKHWITMNQLINNYKWKINCRGKWEKKNQERGIIIWAKLLYNSQMSCFVSASFHSYLDILPFILLLK